MNDRGDEKLGRRPVTLKSGKLGTIAEETRRSYLVSKGHDWEAKTVKERCEFWKEYWAQTEFSEDE
jgi:hypothetical protein